MHKNIILFASLFLSTFSFASGVTVTSPKEGAIVNSPFGLQASAPTCEGKVTSAMGYSLDNSRDTTIIHDATSINSSVASSPGNHILHVKAWAKGGAACHTSLKILVSGETALTHSSTTLGYDHSPHIPIPPASAKLAAKIQGLDGWQSHTGAASQCPDGVASATCKPISANFGSSITHPADPAPLSNGDGVTGKFELYQGPPHATAIWGKTALKDLSARNFIWDFYLYTSSRDYSNLELDLYAIANGQRFMLGMQCDRGKKSWDTWNEETQHWIHNPQIACDFVLPPSTWHRVILFATIDPIGKTYTYHTLRIDGVDYDLNQTEPAKSIYWPDGSIGLQLQLDANSTGSPVAGYVEKMMIYAW